MGLRFEGNMCASCNSVIEGTNFIVCNTCKGTIHNTEYCKTIHRNSCRKTENTQFQRPLNIDSERLPDVRDIFK